MMAADGAADGAAPLVEFSRVSKRFGGVAALDGVSFTVPAGQICGLLGPNGAGKTTLFRLLMGIMRASEGRVTVQGRDAFEDRVALKRLIGYVPDEPIFYSYLSGRETLALSAAMHGLAVTDALARLRGLLERLALAGALDQSADGYSRGMKKKLALALALLHAPSLLILDEPTNGLDVTATRVFCDLMREAAAAGTTILLSSHLLDQVARLCSDAVIIARGRVVARGTLAALEAASGAAGLEAAFLALTAGAP